MLEKMIWSNEIIKDPDPSDIYWGTISNNNDFSTALVYNQNQFKRFCRETLETDSRYDLTEISNPRYMWWTERYPFKYPCKVQFWSHFEGSMLYLAIEYI